MIIEVSLPIGALGLLRSPLPAGTRVELERGVATTDGFQRSILVTGTDGGSGHQPFEWSELVDDVRFVDEVRGGSVYWVSWEDPEPTLLAVIRRTGGMILTAVAEDDDWTFEIRFPTREAASRFYSEYDDGEHPITVRSTSSNGRASGETDDSLTPAQREALEHALADGYFEVPRKTTLIELAEELEISDSAVSQRLRRGLTTVLGGRPVVPAQDRSTAISTD